MLDARNFYFKPLNDREDSSVFDRFVAPKTERPQIQCRVRFTNLGDLQRGNNGVSFGIYGEGTLDEYEAVKLTDGTYLFCLVSGRQFNGTFSPESQVSMKYWEVTPLKKEQ